MADELDPNASTTKDGRKLRRPVEEVRAELLASPDVKEQAKLLQIPVADYVEKILDYALHPQKPAQIAIVPDENLKQYDPSIPTVAEMKGYLEKVVSGEIVISPAHLPDGFTPPNDAQKYQAALGTQESLKGAPETGSSTAAQVLAAQKKPSDKP